MGITDYRRQFRPFEYPKYYEIYQTMKKNPWTELEMHISKDYADWVAAEQWERDIIGGSLSSFVITETFIDDYWANRVPRLFPKHEIVSLCRIFSYNERIHADAYALLSTTFGLDNFDAFIGDPVLEKKLSIFLDSPDDVVSLGVFSGAVEGVSLFGTFSVLLSFSRNGRFRGLREGISWSIMDEQAHSDTAILLLNDYVKEKGGLTKEQEDSILEGYRTVVDNEKAVLQQTFNGRGNKEVNYENTVAFMLLRANERLTRSGLPPIFNPDLEKAHVVKEWFDPLAKGLVNQDFFAAVKEGGNYIAKPQQKYDISMLKGIRTTI